MKAPPGETKARFAMAAESKSSLKAVQLDGQVVLKIMQHCNESQPQLVTGQLLGLDVGHTLEVTDCFAFPVRGARSSRCSSKATSCAAVQPPYDAVCI